MIDEKPKRSPSNPDDLKAAYREFYRQLFIALMIPALLLGVLFALPAFLLNHLPERVADVSCVAVDDQQALRLTLSDGGTPRATLNVALSTDSGRTWQAVFSTGDRLNQFALDCAAVRFHENHAIFVYGNTIAVVSPDRTYRTESVAACDSLRDLHDVRSYKRDRMLVTVRCASGTLQTVQFSWDMSHD